MNVSIRPRLARMLAASVFAASIASTGCDIVTAEFRSTETAEWHKTYTLNATGRVEIHNTNGKIVVEPSGGATVDVRAVKKARASSPEAAKAALERITFTEDVAADHVRIDTKTARTEGMFSGGSPEVEYHVKVPAGAEVKLETVNGGVEITGLQGRVVAETTNGGITARNIAGSELQASTTNGGLDIDLAKMPEGGVKLECTNGGIDVKLPRDAKATISASISNGGIDTNGLQIETSGDNNRRRLEGRLNGGGPRLDIQGVNGGVDIVGR